MKATKQRKSQDLSGEVLCPTGPGKPARTTTPRLIASGASPKPLYAALGLPESATSEEIRAAFLSISRAHHPDLRAGVESELFSNAKRAYETLSDPAKRALYDECGIDADEGGRVRAMARDAIRQTAMAVLEDGDNDIPGRIRYSLKRDVAAIESQLRNIDRSIVKAESRLATIERRWKGAETARAILLAMLREQIEQKRTEKLPLNMNVETAKLAIAMLDGATWEADMQPPPPSPGLHQWPAHDAVFAEISLQFGQEFFSGRPR